MFPIVDKKTPITSVTDVNKKNFNWKLKKHPILLISTVSILSPANVQNPYTVYDTATQLASLADHWGLTCAIFFPFIIPRN